MEKFTVIGAYDENGTDTFAIVVEAEDAAAAELSLGEDVWIAAVLAGEHEVSPAGEFPAGTEWAVLAWYIDNEQRHGAHVHASSVEEAFAAAQQAVRETLGLEPEDADALVCCGAVQAGAELQCADIYANSEYWAAPVSSRPAWCEFDYSL